MGYIGVHGVETLKYVLQPFWSRCVTLLPMMKLRRSTEGDGNPSRTRASSPESPPASRVDFVD